MKGRLSEGLLVALLLAVGGVLRLIWLDTVPPGWHYDEAVQGVWAREILWGVQRPIFFSAFTGQEPLYMYLAAGVMALVGDQGAFTIRLTSALIGLGTLLFSYLLLRQWYGPRLAWLGTALLVISLWHVMGSRNGYRTISQPLFQVLTLYLLVRGLRSGRWWHYAGAGAALAATAYTYIGSRAFPLLLGFFALWWLMSRGLPPAKVRWGLGLFLAVAGALFAPLGYHFITHPTDFYGRAEQVIFLNPELNEGNPWGALGDSLLKTLGVFTWYGDPLWRFNVPERPLFVGALAPLFYLGLLLLLIQVRRGEAASVFVLMWLGVMLLPMLFSAEAMPYTQRGVGIIPGVFLLPALGIGAVWNGLQRLLAPRLGRLARGVPILLLGALLLTEAAITWHDYFRVRSQSFAAALDTDVDLVGVAGLLERIVASGGDVEIFVSTEQYHDPVLSHLAPRAYSRLRWMNAKAAIPLPPSTTKDLIYIFPWSAMPRDLEALFPGDAVLERQTYPNGVTKYVAYRLTPEQLGSTVARIFPSPSSGPVPAAFGDHIELLAYQVGERVQVGKTLPVTLLWRVRNPPDSEDYAFFVHLVDHRGQAQGQGDALGYPVPEWRPGDLVVGTYDIPVPKGTLPGIYRVFAGVYHRGTQARLPLSGRDAPGEALELGRVKVPPDEVVAPQGITHPVQGRFGTEIQLLGYELHSYEPWREGSLGVTLFWEALERPRQDYTVFVHLVNDRGELVAQSDGMPVGGGFPTSSWDPGERVKDPRTLVLPGALVPGRYTLIAGLYLLGTGERLATEGGADQLSLASFAVPAR